MKPKLANNSFVEQVFPAELEEVRNRRRESGDDRLLADQPSPIEPSTDHELVGLALSGGGIRSASFSLGIVQYLIKHGLFKHVDYLSTVSGGGYTGTCISSLMQAGRGGERLLVDRTGLEEPPAINHLRNGSNFLLPVGMLNRLRMPSLYVIGFLQNLLLFLPPVILLVFLTELFFELTSHLELPVRRYWLATVGLLPLVLQVLIRPVRQMRKLSWERRDRSDRRAGFYLALACASLIAVPILASLEYLVDNDFRSLGQAISERVDHHLGLWPRSWLMWTLLGFAVLFIVGLVRFSKTIALACLALLGPLSLLVFYLACCVYVINSPDVLVEVSERFSRALSEYQETGNQEPLQAAVNEILDSKEFNPVYYQANYDSIDRSLNVKAPVEVLRVGPESTRPWWYQFRWLSRLTTHYQDKVTIKQHHWRPDRKFIPELSLLQLRTNWFVYLGALILWLFNYSFVNVNRMSLNPFYRDRLSRTFLIRPSETGVEPADGLLLSELRQDQSAAPYHLINAALNLQGMRDPQLRQRKTVPFLLSKRFCGCEYTGYCETSSLEKIDRDLNLGTAMAVSAGAAGPTMGVKTVKSLTLVMTLLNIRLAYWLPNPSWIGRNKWWYWLVHRNPGLACLITEAMGTPSNRFRFINCSDGGHIENLGMYELLRRHCSTIVCVDAGGDPKFEFLDLTTLQRYANIDLNVQIEIDPKPLLPNEKGVSQRQYVTGKISYPNGQIGTLIYLKLAYCDDEPEYVRFYKRNVPLFPHESSADQFFDETKFEVYRALGEHVAQRAFSNPETLARTQFVVSSLRSSVPSENEPNSAESRHQP